MKNQNACRYFLRSTLKLFLITIAFILSFTAAAVANSYTVSTNVNATTLSGRTEDTLYIDAVVTLNTNEIWNFTAVIMRAPNGTIYWANNSNLLLPGCAIFNIQAQPTTAPGLQPTGGNASKVLIIAGVKVAVSNDNASNAAFSFEEFTYLGGLPKFTITSNSPVCNGDALLITATPDRSSTISYNYNWTISPVSGTFNPVSSNSSTSATTAISPSSGSYTITCTINATGDPLATATVNVIVNALPATPASVTVLPATVCAGGSSNLNATSTGNTIRWYTVASGGTNIGTSTSGANFSVTPASTTIYYAEASSAPGCKSATRAAVTLTVNALPTAFSVTGGGSYCSGGSGLAISLSGSQSGVNYQLYNGTSIVGSAVAGTGSAISFGNQTSAGTYTVAATKATTSCITNMTGSAIVTINSRPTSVIGPATQSLCNGSDANITVALAGTAPWVLTFFDGSASTTVSGISTSPYTFNVSPGSTKTYTITALSDANCTSIAGDRTGNATITVNPRPTGILSGSTTICNGISATLSLVVTGTGTISGALSDGTAFSGTAPTITLNVSPNTTTIYTIAALTNSTCTSIAADLTSSATVTVNQRPTAVLSGTTTICNGSSAILSLAVTGSGTISGTLSDGNAFSGTAPTITVNVSPNTTKTYTIATLTNSICASIAADKTGSATVTVNQRPTGVLSGPTTICNGSSTTLSLAVTGSGTISGTLSDGSPFNGTAPTITINVSPNITTTYTIAALTNGTCTSIAADKTGSAIITVNQRPTGVLSGTTTICNGSSATLSLAVTGSGTISGALSDGTAFSGTAPTITLNVSPNTTNTYTIATLNNSICASIAADKTGSSTVTVNQRPTGVLSGTTNICNGSSATLSLAVTGSGIVSGILSEGTAFSGAGPTITVTLNPNATTTYAIATLTDSACTSSATDKTGSAILTVNLVPMGVLSGSTTICKGTSASLSLAVTGSGTMSGTLSDGTAFSGTAPTITVNVSPAITTTYFIATLTNGTCSSTGVDLSGTITVTVNDPIIIDITNQPSDAIFCAGSDATFSVTASGDAALIYKWQISPNGITYADISGAPYSGVATGTLNIIAASAALHGNYYRVIVTSPSRCSVPAISDGVRLLLTNYWTGLTSNDWNTATNWSGNIVPTLSCADVYISGDALYQPALSTGTATINNLIIKAGAVLTINGTLKIAGAITNAGIFDVINGAIEFNGSSDQSIPANVFYNNIVKDLIISNNVSLAGPASLTGILSFGSTGKMFTTNGNLTLKSSAANTSVVGQVINGNNIAGDVTVERYIPAKRAWYYLSVPTQTFQSVKQAWKEGALHSEDNFVSGYGTQVTDNTPTWAADGFDYYSPDGPSVKKYNPVTKTYIGIANTSVNIASKEGWMTFVRGDRTAIGLSAISTPTVLRTKGSLHIGTQPVMSIPARQFSSVGNPYASPLDMRKISKSGLPNVFYLWDPNLGTGLGAFQTFSLSSDGNYKPTPGGGSYPAGGVPYNYIQSGLAFFVLGDVATGTVTLTENSKASSSSENILPSWSEADNKSGGQLRTNMYASGDNKNFTLVDGTLNLFANKYDDAVDINDAKKIPGFNLAENISIKTDSQLLAVERRHAIDEEDTVLLNMEKMEVRYYRFQFIAQDFDPSITAFLEDSYNNTRIPLNINGTSVYDFNVVNIADSWNPARFRIVFKPGVSMQLSITHNAVMMGQSRSQIMVYPNPVTDGNINLQLINQPKGKYGIRLINKVGQVVTTKQIEHAEGSSTETFRTNKTLAHGTYQLEVIKPDNSRVNIKVLY